MIRSQQTRVSSENGLMEIWMAHIATIDKKILLAILSRHLRFANETVDIYQFGIGHHID